MRKILLLLGLFKVLCLAILATSLALWGNYDGNRAAAIREAWFPSAEAELLRRAELGFGRHFTTWDSAHYLVLSKAGYSRELRSCAFYPLWPLSVRAFSAGTRVNLILSGVLLSNIFSLAGWALFWRVTGKRFGESAARWALVFLLVFPGSLFYQFNYSESLFFLLTMLLWLGLEEDRRGLAWVAAFLLPMTRAVGLFAVLPVLWSELVRLRLCGRAHQDGALAARASSPAIIPVDEETHWIGDGRSKTSVEAGSNSTGIKASIRQIFTAASMRVFCAKSMPLLIAPVLGWVLYLALMWRRTGNPFQGFAAQANWKAHSIENLWNMPKFALSFFEPTSLHEFRGSVLDRCGFLMLLYTAPMLWRVGKDLLVWVFVLGIIPAMSGTFISFIRFESTAFPVFIALGILFSNEQRRWIRAALIAGMVCIHAALAWRFVNYGWAG